MMKRVLVISFMTTTIYAGSLFSVGQKNFGFSVGSSTGFGNTYTVVGGNFNYFVMDSLSMGVGYQGWFGHKPRVDEINIPVTYYFQYSPQYYPYIGFRYAHTSVGKYDGGSGYDYNTYGARAGVAMNFGNNSYMSIGWVQDYREKDGISKSEGYPEVSMGIGF